MKRYTQQEFDAFETVDHIKLCPSGDYSEISTFGEGCRFSERCIFANHSRFGDRCSFGGGSYFGDQCSFGEWCVFGGGSCFGARCNFSRAISFCKRCIFGEWCNFSGGTVFGGWARFSECCSFGNQCLFGECCYFGELCLFGEGIRFEGGYLSKGANPFLSITGAGTVGRTSYFFNFSDGIYVRSACFFGTLNEFRAAVKVDCGGDLTKIKALQYLGFANIAAATFDASLIEL